MISVTFKQRTYRAEFIGLTTLNAAPMFRLIAGNDHMHTATNHESAWRWLCDHGLKKSKALKLIAAAQRGEEGILSAGESGSASAEINKQANR